MDATFTVLPAYAELFCLSNFSFLHGASHAEELAQRAAQLGYSGLAITDECSLAGIVRAHVAAKEANLPFVVGSYFRLVNADGSPAFGLILLAQNREGYGNLSELITLARTRGRKGTYRLTPHDLSRPDLESSHLRGVPDCLAILIPHFPAKEDVLDVQLEWLAQTFPNRAWCGLVLHQRAMDDIHRGAVEYIADGRGIPVVALGQAVMHVRSRKPLQDTMTAIRVGRPVQECGYDLSPNAEQHLRSRLRLVNLYPEYALAETTNILSRCSFSLDELRYEYPDELVPKGVTPTAYLRQETYIGARRRFQSGIPYHVQEQIEHELELIRELEYEPYFLTVYDIVRFARSQHILCQGRGSAANSAVCYCLGVTEVDPARGNMLFERFISKERGEPPDIDVDFEHQRREEVIQYIYRKYGRDRAAIAAAVSTYRPRGALRETGKALGVDPQIVDAVAKSHQWFDGKQDLLNRFSESGLNPETPLIQLWASLASQLLGFLYECRHDLAARLQEAEIAVSKIALRVQLKIKRLFPPKIQHVAFADVGSCEWQNRIAVAVVARRIEHACNTARFVRSNAHHRIPFVKAIAPHVSAACAHLEVRGTQTHRRIRQHAQCAIQRREWFPVTRSRFECHRAVPAHALRLSVVEAIPFEPSYRDVPAARAFVNEYERFFAFLSCVLKQDVTVRRQSFVRLQNFVQHETARSATAEADLRGAADDIRGETHEHGFISRERLHRRRCAGLRP